MTAGELVLDAFAGPGGWDTGLRLAGYDGYVLGIEHDQAACRTAHAAGHPRVQADVATFPLDHLAGKVDGLIASPPCQAWSNAGKRDGFADQARVYGRIAAFANVRAPADVEWVDERSKLTAEPMRWAVALRPRWIALEQVPPVLELWEYTAVFLRQLGYAVWTGVLSAEEYGVPQTRRRAILTASLDGPVRRPAPTHQPYRAGRDFQTAQAGEIWRVGRDEALLVWVRKVFDDGAVDCIPVVLDTELADDSTLLISADATPLGFELAAMTALRTHLPVEVFINVVCFLDIAAEVAEVMEAAKAGRSPVGVRVGSPIVDDADRRIEYRTAVRDVLTPMVTDAIPAPDATPDTVPPAQPPVVECKATERTDKP